ncbi:MAG: bifunctional 5,10-methylenetetrahydrofolate dehydrogenase/5,10-methenyltetrahydrofolate cyclohydrolase [Clostridiales bacterium]|jgi:methylenetetrahydrofolate dehydrogenase (NADP+)/methenyltetrahydrofolate cyclohydrolase|nr:bifunctional 5,10-methylenetetrahydrofolate dehydrogenase/5,10-methenyltetrahydrofolate cyclohydrolase [Clostridiales bacterium]
MAIELKGAPVAAAINERSQAELHRLLESGISPTLAIVRVGEREDDIAYENGASKRCEKVGVAVRNVVLPENITQNDLTHKIEELNADKSVHGVLIFMPLPKHLDGEAVRRTLSPEKDVDGITDGSLAGVFTGSKIGFSPCTAQACIEILDHYGIDCKGKRAVVIGRSLVVGKPAAMLLIAKHATVTVCHTRTVDMPSITRDAEILIVAAGKAKVIGDEYFSENQVVVDVGINFADGVMCGDVDFSAANRIVSAITPVPGGVGTVTTSVLVNHVIEAAKRQNCR